MCTCCCYCARTLGGQSSSLDNFVDSPDTIAVSKSALSSAMSLCVRVLCFLVTLGVLLPTMSGEWGYTNTWAVEILEGGDEMADQIAEKYGFVNRGLVSP